MSKRGRYMTLAYSLLLLTMLSGTRMAYAQSKPALEYQVKAAFLFNFTRFVHWPPSAFPSTDAPFVIGVAGDDPFGLYIDDLVSGERVDGHKIIVRRYPDGGDMSNCHLIFIHVSDQQKLKSILSQVSRQNVLSVGDDDEFIRMGGMLHFYMEDKKVKMEIRLAAAKSAQLEISAKLLQIAKLR